MSDGPGPKPAPAAHGAPAAQPVLSLALVSLMHAVGAHSGAVYLLRPDEPVLEMAVHAGMPRAFAAPWSGSG
ncbi:hypothetical protein [Streptomyces echinatus]|uniref:hypothetical protein n=1 Tax=Streptomyces echinatus TaxID=67293 RepID=UPI0031EB54DB